MGEDVKSEGECGKWGHLQGNAFVWVEFSSLRQRST